MIINLNYDTSVDSAPDEFKIAVNYVSAAFERLFADPITITVNVGWGELGEGYAGFSQPLPSNSLGASISVNSLYSYSPIVNQLASDATSADDALAVANMVADPTGGAFVDVPNAEAKAIGLTPFQGANTPPTDGFMGFDSTQSFNYSITNRAVAGQYDFIGVVAHELSELLGRVDLFSGQSLYSPYDLFRFTGPNTISVAGGETDAYFSLDGGNTPLLHFNTQPGGDLSDWAGSAGNDSFLAFSNSGVANELSLTDLKVLDALGYDLATLPTAYDIGSESDLVSALQFINADGLLAQTNTAYTLAFDLENGGIIVDQNIPAINPASGSTITLVDPIFMANTEQDLVNILQDIKADGPLARPILSIQSTFPIEFAIDTPLAAVSLASGSSLHLYGQFLSDPLIGDVHGPEFVVSSEAEFINAIDAINQGGALAGANNDYIIDLQGSPALDSSIPAIDLASGSGLFVVGTFAGGTSLTVESGTLLGNHGADVTIAGGALVADGTGGISFAAGIAGTLIDSNGSLLTTAIKGFALGDTIDITHDNVVSGAMLGANNVLNTYDADRHVGVHLQLDPTQDFSGYAFSVTGDGGDGTNVTMHVVQTSWTIASVSDWNTAITRIDQVGDNAAPDTHYTFTFTADLALTGGDLLAINLATGASLTIEGANHVIDGADQFRGLFVYNGNVTIDDLTIQHTLANGGAGGIGGGGGGGGAGLGGGLYIAAGGVVTLYNVAMLQDAAIGGTGGASDGGDSTGNAPAIGHGGGGGGLGGVGGSEGGGGGGIGYGASGGNGVVVISDPNPPFNATTIPGTSGEAGIVPGAPVTVQDENGYVRGQLGGGGIGDPYSVSNGAGGGIETFDSDLGIAGGYGGGGGAGLHFYPAYFDFLNNRNVAAFTGDVAQSGGFGGGGGGASQGAENSDGASGGFGGGGGGGYSSGDYPSPIDFTQIPRGFGAGGGFGAGAGGDGVNNVDVGDSNHYTIGGGGGGGGLGAGGGIFVEQGGSLTIGSGSVSGGSVTGGTGGSAADFTNGGPELIAPEDLHPGTSGSAFGSGIFFQGQNVLTFSPASGQTLTISDVIADEVGSGGTINPNTGFDIYPDHQAALDMEGAGTVVLGAANTYSGGTTIGHGTLDLEAVGAAGSGDIVFVTGQAATLAIGLGDAPSQHIDNFYLGQTVDLLGIGLATTVTPGGSNAFTFSGGASPVTLDFSPTDDLRGVHFELNTDNHGGTYATLAVNTTVANETELNDILRAIDAGGRAAAVDTHYTITITSDFNFDDNLYAINLLDGDTLTINGGGHAISGASQYRGFFVYDGTLTLQNLTLTDMQAAGGTGGNGLVGGGGGAGLGGALFIGADGHVTLDNVNLSSNAAFGGSGGGSGGAGFNGGGGGGLGGAGQSGGGGIGGGDQLSAVGGDPFDPGNSGVVLGAAGAAASLDNDGGAFGGGGGGEFDGVSGGGGIGAIGADGGFGGGGGGTDGVSAGDGGFGGGGAGVAGSGLAAGDGGFGGGGGGADTGSTAGIGGFGAGDGVGGSGGGGLGAGGAIFLQEGATLTYVEGSATSNSVFVGSGGLSGNLPDLFIGGTARPSAAQSSSRATTA